MQSVPGHIAEGDSQAQVQVEQLMDKGEPVSQSRFTRGTGRALGHRDGAAGYDGIQVHSRVSQSLLWARPCQGRTGLDMIYSVPGRFKFPR